MERKQYSFEYAFELDIVFILDLPIKHYLFLPSKNLEPF